MKQAVLVIVLTAFAALSGNPAAAQEADDLFAPFDAAALTAEETGLLQGALVASGDYRGALDGAWSAQTRSALADYAERDFDDDARNVHAAALYIAFAEALVRDDWQQIDLEDLGVSLALPTALLGAPEAIDGVRRWRSVSGGISVQALRQSPEEARFWHGFALGKNAVPEALAIERTGDVLLTAGLLDDGRRFFTRSDRIAGAWSTVSVAIDPFEPLAIDLIGASVRPGAAAAWELPRRGRLAALVEATLALLGETDAVALRDAEASWGDPVPPQTISRTADGGEMLGSGTGFYLADRIIVTAQHVVAGCNRVRLRDGTPLTLVAEDVELDVAALAAPGPAPAWLTLAGGAAPRLGQPVHAFGFPYYALAGTSLNLTSGNISALAGIDDDGRFFSFTAPVQPGNSGGPLVGQGGEVMGVVVARLSEDFIVDATGTIPQNVNYALGNRELLDFLERSGVALADGGLGFDMMRGAPVEIDKAIVPIICE